MNSTDTGRLETLIKQVRTAQQAYSRYSQKEVDQIFKKAALAANDARIQLAQSAVNETGMGIVEDKVIKNHFASEYIYNKYKTLQTCGVVSEQKSFGVQTVAEPVGVLAGVVPVTNPTSTTIFKALLALKTRNGIIFSPHPRAKHCTAAAAKIVLEAAVEAGAPEHIIGWIDEPSLNLSQALMQHPAIDLILATGGSAMVHAAYSSGHPSLGVGAGNTPAIIDETADIEMAVSSVLLSKSFDNGMICASEQSVIVLDAIYDQVKDEFIKRGGYFLSPEQTQQLGGVLFIEGHLNIELVGQSVSTIAAIAGIEVPPETRLLIGEVSQIGEHEPFSSEKLAPIVAMYRAADFADALNKAETLVEFAGRGHTSVLHTLSSNASHIRAFEERLKTVRMLINTPASQGAIGDLYNFHLDPSLTLGCGSWGGNTISGNLTPNYLLNFKTVTDRRENMLWFRVPPKVYLKNGCLSTALGDLKGRERAFIVTDKPLYQMGLVKNIELILEQLGILFEIFYDVEPDPSLKTVHAGLARINSFQPDVIIAVGGGSPMDAAKVMWLLYEHPQVEFDGIATRFMDIRKRVYELPPLGNKALMVAIPTTSGTGSEVTPFAVVTDDRTGIKYPLADYALTPSIAIIDAELTMHMPKRLTAYGGIDALTHALEAYVSVCATEFTNGLALEAIRLLFKYLPSAYAHGADDPKAREKVHYAATIAGMAFANAFLGVCHSLAHKLGSAFHVPHGLANALMISHVIRYNATDAPFKQTIFPQYHYPSAKWHYANIADYLQLGGHTEDEKVDLLIRAIEKLKRQLDLPTTIKEALGKNISEEQFVREIETLAVQAFDDQCTGANPRYPLINDLKQLYLEAYGASVKGGRSALPEESLVDAA